MADELLFKLRIRLKDGLTETVIKQLLDDLRYEKVLNSEEADNILEENLNRADKARNLIDSVVKKGRRASEILIEKLQINDETLYKSLNIDNLLKHESLAPAGSRKGAVGAPLEDQTTDTVMDEYPMKSKPRGLCVIMNNEQFTNPEENRSGSKKDADALKEVFEFLGFTVKMHKDLSAEKMKELMLRYSKQQHNGDCFVCCVLSHGKSMGVLGCDWNLCPMENIFTPFDGKNCSTLVGKPKVFFIQACRGLNKQEVSSDDAEGTDISLTFDSAAVSYGIPQSSDFLIARSTVDNYISYRSPGEGSWFIQSLCKHLREGSSRGDDIHTILTRVNDEVSRKEARLCNKDGVHLAKMIPEPTYTLRKKLVFRIP